MVVARCSMRSFFFWQQRQLQCGNDGARNLVLQREDVVQVAVVTLAPDLASFAALISCAVMRTRAPALRTLPASTYDRLGLSPDFTDAALGAFERKRHVARHDREGGHLAEIGDDVLGDAVPEVFLLGVAAHVRKRQHADADFRLLLGGGCRGRRLAWRAQLGLQRLAQALEGRVLRDRRPSRRGRWCALHANRSAAVRCRGAPAPARRDRPHRAPRLEPSANRPTVPSRRRPAHGPRSSSREINAVEFLARRNLRIPPDGPAFGLECRHQRCDASLVLPGIGDKDVGQRFTSLFAATLPQHHGVTPPMLWRKTTPGEKTTMSADPRIPAGDAPHFTSPRMTRRSALLGAAALLAPLVPSAGSSRARPPSSARRHDLAERQREPLRPIASRAPGDRRQRGIGPEVCRFFDRHAGRANRGARGNSACAGRGRFRLGRTVANGRPFCVDDPAGQRTRGLQTYLRGIAGVRRPARPESAVGCAGRGPSSRPGRDARRGHGTDDAWSTSATRTTRLAPPCRRDALEAFVRSDARDDEVDRRRGLHRLRR